MTSKNRVNLYLPSMRPVKEKLPLSLIISSWFAMLVVSAAASYYLYDRHAEVIAALNQSNVALQTSTAELSQLQARHADFKPSPLLLTKLDRLTQELNGKRFLNRHLTGKTDPVAQNYSTVMVDMGRLHSDNLWLTKMRFDEQGVFLKGYALDALAVPMWLTQLQQSPFFAGKSFALMNLKNEKSHLITFEINTLAQAELSEEEKLDMIKAMSKQLQAGQQ